MSDPVLPPAIGLWWQPAETLSAVMHKLRLDAVVDDDVDAVTAAIAAAAEMIDQYIDADVALVLPHAPLQAALEQLAIELYEPYRRASGAGEAPAFFNVSDELFQTVEPMIRPYRQRWGVA